MPQVILDLQSGYVSCVMQLMADNDVINGNLEMALTLSDGLRDSLNEALAKIKVLEHAQKEDSLHSHHCAEVTTLLSTATGRPSCNLTILMSKFMWCAGQCCLLQWHTNAMHVHSKC